MKNDELNVHRGVKMLLGCRVLFLTARSGVSDEALVHKHGRVPRKLLVGSSRMNNSRPEPERRWDGTPPNAGPG